MKFGYAGTRLLGCEHLLLIFALYWPVCLATPRRITGFSFVRRDVWHVTFLEPGLERPLPKTLTFRDEGKIRELARRGEAWKTSEDRQLLDYAIAKGEGGIYLRLSPEQYARLLQP